jgi:hypothetical protein
MTAQVAFSPETNMRTLLQFTEKLQEVWKEAMKATKRGDYMELTISRTVNSWDPQEVARTWKQEAFDYWTFEGYNEDLEGIYLAPDTKYTAAECDLYLTKNILESLEGI